MAKKMYDETLIAAIAAKIRELTGSTTLYSVSDMPAGIDEVCVAGYMVGNAGYDDVILRLLALEGGKQDNLEFDGIYDAENNKVATVDTVTREVAEGIAQLIADAPESLNTLQELATWLETNGKEAAEMNTAIQANADEISALKEEQGLQNTAIAKNAQDIAAHKNAQNNPHGVTAEQVGALPLTGGMLQGVLFTSASTPLFIGAKGKVGMRAASDTVVAPGGHVGQMNISNSWWDTGNQWGAQMSGYNGVTGKYNELRVSHEGVQYFDEDSNPNQVLHEGNYESYLTPLRQEIQNLADTKQDNLSFDGTYNPTSNKVATVKTVTDKVAAMVAGAPAAFDTLKEISDYIASDKTGAATMNNTIAQHSADIADIKAALLAFKTETFTFTLADGSTVNKVVCVK